MKTWFILMWFSSALCNNNGIMTPCAHMAVFETEEGAITYAKEDVVQDYSYQDKDWNKSVSYQLWKVTGSSSSLTVSRTIKAVSKGGKQ